MLWELVVTRKHESDRGAATDFPSVPPNSAAQDAPIDQDPAKTIEELQKHLAATQAELAEANDKMLRFRAEADNTRKRASIDVENAHKYGMEKLARELLNVVDSLERGIQISSDDPQQTVHLHEGMELTNKLLLDTLDKFNIKQINPLGEVFDPKQHEALTMQPTTDLAPNRVLSVVQRGFSINDRILRPARVIVAKAPE